jgi:hypothetical protein
MFLMILTAPLLLQTEGLASLERMLCGLYTEPAHVTKRYQFVALVGFHGFFVEKSHENHDVWAAAPSVCEPKVRRSLSGRKGAKTRLFSDLGREAQHTPRYNQ